MEDGHSQKDLNLDEKLNDGKGNSQNDSKFLFPWTYRQKLLQANNRHTEGPKF